MASRRSDAHWLNRDFAGVPGWGLVVSAMVVVAVGGFAWWKTAQPEPTASWTPIVRESSTPEPDPLMIAVLGDSYTTGSDMNTDGHEWHTMLDVSFPYMLDIEAVGGTGYTVGDDLSFVAREPRLTSGADLVVLFGSRNDIDADPGDISAASAEVVEAVQARMPDATIVMVGPPWVNITPPESMLGVRDALAATASTHGVAFVDPMAEEWIDGEGLIGEDGVHPTDAGHELLAAHMSEVIERFAPISE